MFLHIFMLYFKPIWLLFKISFLLKKVEKNINYFYWLFWEQLIVVLAAAGDGAAVFMAELGKHGNSHARWNKICDKFQTFCDHGSGALIASFIGLILLLIINIISIAKLLKPKSDNTI